MYVISEIIDCAKRRVHKQTNFKMVIIYIFANVEISKNTSLTM